MAIRLLGPRLDWAIQTRSRQFQVCIRAGRQVLQVDRVHAISQSNFRLSCRIPQSNHTPIWGS